MQGPSAAKEVRRRIRNAADRAAAFFKIAGRLKLIDELREAQERTADLHDLPKTKKLPFLAEGDFSHPSPFARRLAMAHANFTILRNYAAHHDCLDHELVAAPLAPIALEALVVVALSSLQATKPPRKYPARKKPKPS